VFSKFETLVLKSVNSKELDLSKHSKVAIIAIS